MESRYEVWLMWVFTIGVSALSLDTVTLVNQTEEWKFYQLENGLRNMRVELEITAQDAVRFAVLLESNAPPALTATGAFQGKLMDVDGWNFARSKQHMSFAVTSDTHLYYIAVYVPSGRMVYKLRTATMVTECPSYCPDKHSCKDLACICPLSSFASACTEHLQSFSEGDLSLTLESNTWQYFSVVPHKQTSIDLQSSLPQVDCFVGYG